MKNRSHAAPLAATAGIVAALFHLSLHAQSAAAPEPAAAADTQTAADFAPLPTIPLKQAAPAAPEVDADELQRADEIVVVAQKREQRLQDVPVAVTVVTQKQLQDQNISDASDLARAVPAVEFNGPSGNYNSKTGIRGLSTESYSRTAEQAVSFVLDGVVLGKAPTTTLFDINRIEVLRGPQGTLFGKNASAGVINIVTNAPDPTAFSAAARVDLGADYNYRLSQAAINVPLADDLAVRVNAGQTYYTGLLHNNVQGHDSKQDAEGGRVRLLWRPSDALTLNLIADYEQQDVTEQTFTLFSQYVDRDTQQPQALPDCGGAYASRENRITCNGSPTFADRKAYGYSAQIDWQIDDYALTSITALRRYSEDSAADVDGLPGDYYRNGNRYRNRVFSQELRIASPTSDTLSYVAGLYYSDTRVPNLLTNVIGTDGIVAVPQELLGTALCADFGLCLADIATIVNPNTYTAEMKSEAVFGELTWRLLDTLRLLAGGRYTRDDVSLDSAAYLRLGSQNEPLDDVLSMSLLTISNESAQDRVANFSWRLGVQYDVLAHSMAYFTASNGYKGPQIVYNAPVLLPSLNNGAATSPHNAYISVVKPEYPRAYEIGVKNSLFGGAIVANASLFYTKVRDYQSSQFNDNAEFVPVNISSVVSKGAELDLFGFIAHGWSANLGVLYNRVTYPSGYLWPCTQIGHGCSGTSSSDYEDIGGHQLPDAPVWKVTLSSEYEHHLFSRINGFVSGNLVFRSSVHFMPNDDTRTELGSRAIVGARLGVRGEEGTWEVSLFARNLTNAYNPGYLLAPYLADELSAPNKDTAGQVLTTESFRFFGLSAGVRF